MERHYIFCYDPTHPPFGDAWTGRARRPAPAPCRQRPGNEPPGRRRPVTVPCRPSLSISPLGCDSDTTAGGPPRRGRLAALGPTRSRVARHERTCDSDDSERAGGKEAAARATASRAKMCLATPANRPPITPTPDAAEAKVSSTGAGSCPAMAKRRMDKNCPFMISKKLTCNGVIIFLFNNSLRRVFLLKSKLYHRIA